MWIKIKTKEGDTLDKIASQYKAKFPEAIWKYAGNKKIAQALKKGEALPKGTEVWVLDPKGKVYILETPKGKKYLDEKQYQDHLKKVHKAMDDLRRRQFHMLDLAKMRHDAQNKINSDQWFVSSICSAFNKHDEPKAGRKKAESAFKKLDGIVKGRKYKQFEDAAVASEVAILNYKHGVIAWIDGLIGTAESAVGGLEVVRDVGAFCGTVAVVTITAPASIPAAMAVGAASSAGVGLTYDVASNASLSANGMKTMSAGEIGKRMLSNGIAGAAGAAIAGNLIKLIKGPVLKIITSNAFVKNQAIRLAKGVLPTKVFEREFANVMKALAKEGTVGIEAAMKRLNPERIMIEALTKFFVRVGTGGFSKEFGASKLVHDWLLSWVKTGPSALQSKDGKSAAQSAANELTKSGAINDFFEEFVKVNMTEFKKDLNAVINSHAQKVAKQAA